MIDDVLYAWVVQGGTMKHKLIPGYMARRIFGHASKAKLVAASTTGKRKMKH
jgi:hypothetical protein